MKERLEEFLRVKHLTQAQLADMIGVGRPSITHLMTGRNQSSDTVTAKMLSYFPDLNPNWLLNGEGEMWKTPETVKQTQTFPHEGLFAMPDEENLAAVPVQEMPVAAPIPQETATTLPINQIPNPQDMQANVQNSPQEIQKTIKEKEIRKIVFFYTDKTFEEYYPQKE
ncbi:MAG: helix-turn-helix domain-containing protein [Bacteroidales bacterium]|jgi:plasmid maintenance system antidote protein VapI|nr:helix-turn-helix domain-containing protein [Bacteroidales bacterium]